tara:strand:- start:11665 stop:11922 length:258 start_codon:yes stop_codon:yes gene_type:complete
MINGSFINILSLPAKSRGEYQTHSAPICLQHCNLLANEKKHPPTERDKFLSMPQAWPGRLHSKTQKPGEMDFCPFHIKACPVKFP